MAHEEGTTQPADEGPVERPVRPRAPQVDAVMQHVYELLRAGTQWQHEHIAAVEAALWQALDDERAAERERCLGAMDSHGRHWVENRSRIIDAVTAAGFQIVSDRDRFWLQPIRA